MASTSAERSPYFTPELFKFLADLEANNDRDWFAANKDRYEADLREPFLDFIADFAPRLEEISPHFVSDPRPVGGSLSRIHRDVRFSKDKRPYKTTAFAHFHHEAGKNVSAPGFYLHIERGEIGGGGGLHHPDPPALRQVRDAIVAAPEEWQAATSGEGFGESGAGETLTLWGEKLKRPPQGYDPEHPLIEDLKGKDFVATATFSEDELCSADFIERFAEVCRQVSPLVGFLTRAVGQPF